MSLSREGEWSGVEVYGLKFTLKVGARKGRREFAEEIHTLHQESGK